MNLKVSAIVVTYNRLDLLKDCLNHLLNQTFNISTIIVVNNNSTDGTTSFLNNIKNPIIKSFTLNKNIGGAGGFSFGTKVAYRKTNSNYFWIMDDDTMPTPSALKELMASAKKLHYDFGFLSSNVRWYENNKPSNIPGIHKCWTELSQEGLIRLKNATFVSFLFSRNDVTQMGLPISDMFIWGDDIEYSTRLALNYRSYFVSNSIVLHKSKMNRWHETIFNDSSNRISLNKYGFRNTLFIDRKYYRKRQLFKDLMLFIYYLIILPFKSSDYRFKREYYLFLGIIKGLFFNPKVKFPYRRN